jgi:hypothetical protein
VQDQKVDLVLLAGNPISVQLFNEKIQLN